MEGIMISDNPASQTKPMEGIMIDVIARPTIGQFSEELISSGGLDDRRRVPNRTGIGSSRPENAPDNGCNSQMPRNSGYSPTGWREWREKRGRKRGQSKIGKSNKKSGSNLNPRQQQLEAEISDMKNAKKTNRKQKQ
jgi:hypothetical protein